MKIGIIGLGLMGGSFAKAVKKYSLATEVYGLFRSNIQKKEVLQLQLVDDVVTLDYIKKECDFIALCVPVSTIIEFLPQLEEIKPNTTIIDMGSTKEEIIKHIPSSIRENFVSTHPMVGTEKNGPQAAVDNFYEGQTIVLCDTKDNTLRHIDTVTGIFQSIGMRIVKMEAHEHDIHACFMSHLPHALSFSLANTVMQHEDPKSIIALAAGGFKDMSRVAKSSPKMWRDIFKQNRANILESIELFNDQLNQVRQLLEYEEYEKLEAWMKQANTLHEIL